MSASWSSSSGGTRKPKTPSAATTWRAPSPSAAASRPSAWRSGCARASRASGASSPVPRSARCRRVKPLDLPFEARDALGPGAGARSVLAEAGWPDAAHSVVVVGHQPTLGEVAARLLGADHGSLAIRKGAIWWFAVRRHGGETLLKAVLDPDVLAASAPGAEWGLVPAAGPEPAMKLAPEQVAGIRARRLPLLPLALHSRGDRGAAGRKCRACTRSTAWRTCARRRARRCAPTSPPTCTAILSPGSRATPAWSSRWCSSSASRCTCTSSRSTARWPSTATSGSGTRTTAPGRRTTTCPRPGR